MPKKSDVNSKLCTTSYLNKDPVLKAKKKKRISKFSEKEPSVVDNRALEPTYSKRLPEDKPLVKEKYVVPKSKKLQKEYEEHRRKLEEELNVCKYEVLRFPSPPDVATFEAKIEAAPDATTGKVLPQKASSIHDLFPEPPEKGALELKKPKSGIIINEGRKVRIVKKKKHEEPKITDLFDGFKSSNHDLLDEDEDNFATFLLDDEEEEDEEGDYDIDAMLGLEKKKRKKVTQISESTSYQEPEEEKPEPDRPRRASEGDTKQQYLPLKKKDEKSMYKKKAKQTTVDAFYFGSKQGNKYQENNYGICTPVVAFCYALLEHPSNWTDKTIDEILEYGERLYEQIGLEEITPRDMPNYLPLEKQKIKFQVKDPEVSGTIRSKDRRILNLSSAMKTFFSRHPAGILQTPTINYMIWRDKYFYLFDSGPRNLDLCSTPEGFAILSVFYNRRELVSVLLDKTSLGDADFVIYEIEGYKVLEKHIDDPIGLDEIFKITGDDGKAVISASWDLGNKCFGFARHKQSLIMTLVALIYAKINPACAWNQNVVNTIMTIGNQLHLAFVKIINKQDYRIELDELPSYFQIGPYAAEINIKSNIFVGVVSDRFTKCFWQEYFECNHNTILDINGFYIGLIKQREFFFCFDPHSRDNEGFRMRDGVGCVSMHKTLESLIKLITKNFEGQTQIFRIHSLKYCSLIHGNLEEILKKHPQQTVESIKKKRATECGDGDVVKMYSITNISRSVRPFENQLEKYIEPITELPKCEYVADLDSPSLSETQIEPIVPRTPSEEDIEESVCVEDEFTHFDEAADEGRSYLGEEHGEDDWYIARSASTSIGSQSLKSLSSCQIDGIPREILEPNKFELPPFTGIPEELVLPDEILSTTQSEEWKKETNYLEMPDGSQIISGSKNIAHFGDDVELIAPFISILAATVAKKYSIRSWSKQIIDYILKCGAELYQNANTRFDQVYKMEIPLISLGTEDFNVEVEYYKHSIVKPKIVLNILLKMLPNVVIFVTPTYSCTIIEKNHIYYMFDGFGNSEVGLGLGPGNTGTSCVTRFRSLCSLICRIIHNKKSRELFENRNYNKFVVSYCHVKKLIPEDFKLMYENDDDRNVLENEREVKNIIGYHIINDAYVIEGSKSAQNDGSNPNFLGVDYFICLYTCLKLFNNQIYAWDTKTIDKVIDEGTKLFEHAQDLDINQKQVIRNILVDGYYFDVVVRQIKKMEFALKMDYLLLNDGAKFNLLYKSNDQVNHRFNPCGANARWTRISELESIKNVIKRCTWFNFEITSFRKMARKSLEQAGVLLKRMKPEHIGLPFNEDFSWLDLDPIPWSPKIQIRKANWFCWNEIHVNDLYSLFGNEHQINIGEVNRNKQTLANLLTSIAILNMYPLDQWSPKLIDSILLYGNQYFEETIKGIKRKNYELSLEDFTNPIEIPPSSYTISSTPIIDGTMFLIHHKSFNLYKALRYFFSGQTKRFGIIATTMPKISHKTNTKELNTKYVSFGKLKESEYFMFDCQSYCHPLFPLGEGVAYAIRMTSLNRLMHVLVLTLRGGDFFIFEVQSQPEIVSAEENE